MPIHDVEFTPLIIRVIALELEPTRAQMHSPYTPRYIAEAAVESIGEDRLNTASDKDRRQMVADFIKRFEFYKTEVPIPDDLSERCFGA